MSGAIVGMGGGGFSEEPDNPLLDRFVLSLAGRERPRVCFVATASGDSGGLVPLPRFAATLLAPDLALDRRGATCGASPRAGRRLRRWPNTLAARGVAHPRPRRHPARGPRAGAVLCGVSAGRTAVQAPRPTPSAPSWPTAHGLGPAGSACPHYDGEPQPRCTASGRGPPPGTDTKRRSRRARAPAPTASSAGRTARRRAGAPDALPGLTRHSSPTCTYSASRRTPWATTCSAASPTRWQAGSASCMLAFVMTFLHARKSGEWEQMAQAPPRDRRPRRSALHQGPGT